MSKISGLVVLLLIGVCIVVVLSTKTGAANIETTRSSATVTPSQENWSFNPPKDNQSTPASGLFVDRSSPQLGHQYAPDWLLFCGDHAEGSNDQDGSTWAVEAYACVNWGETGPEYAYTFFPGYTPQHVTVYLDLLADDLDVFVLSDPGACDSDNCIAYGDYTVSFDAEASTSYYIVVDGRNFAISSYVIYVMCTPIEPTPTYTPTNTPTATPTPTPTSTATPTATLNWFPQIESYLPVIIK